MVSKAMEENLKEEVTAELDEGWWSSILADEETMSVSARSTVGKVSPASSGKVDWEHVRMLFDRDEVVELSVYSYNRGGLLAQSEGIQGFVPISHLVEMPAAAGEEERRQMLAGYIGRVMCLKVIECEPTQERIVLSERAALAGGGRRKILFQQLQPGEVVSGTVTNVTDFGVFVDLGGVEGLIHVSELSWGRVQHPGDVLQIGQRIETQVLSITSIMRFGAFARLEEGVEGLIHISSINLPPGVKDLENILRNGQNVQVRILHIEVERRRLGLGLVTFE
jgi:small subunit ribosomal protein S1